MGFSKDKSVESKDSYMQKNPGKRVVFMTGVVCVSVALVRVFLTEMCVMCGGGGRDRVGHLQQAGRHDQNHAHD